MNLALPGSSLASVRCRPVAADKGASMAQLFSGSSPSRWQPSRQCRDPLRWEIKATKIDKKPIDDSRFATPPGYATVTLGCLLVQW